MIPDAIAAVPELPGKVSVQSLLPSAVTKGGRTFPSENISCPYVTAIMPAHCSVKAGTEPSQFTPEIAMV